MLSGPLPELGFLPRASTATALEASDGFVTWESLEAMVEHSAARLEAHGVLSGSRVVLRMPLGLEYVVALLALLRIRAVPIPLGEDAPEEYLRRVFATAQPEAQIDVSGTIQRCGAEGVARRHAEADEEAYILFTSGSTGAPKGVVGSRAGLCARLAWAATELFSSDVERCAAKTSPVFIDSLTEILGAVHTGRTLVMAPPETLKDLGMLASFLSERSVQQVTATPSCLPVLAGAVPEGLPAVRRWILSGEPLRRSWLVLARRLSPNAEIVNSYGSTEVAGDVMFHRIRANDVLPDPVPIGRPVPGVRYVVSGSGPAGELSVGGDQVALGYLGASSVESSAFRAEAAGQGRSVRWFRTGDIVSPEGDGLVFVGRVGDVTKVRGRRVDVRGLEATAEGLPGVVEAAASVTVDRNDSSRLTLHVVAETGIRLSASEVRRWLLQVLPSEQMPDLVQMEIELPRTTSGKVDRAALCRFDPGVSVLRPETFETDLEFAVASVIAEVAPDLRVDRLSALDDIGVDSFQAVEIAERLTRALGAEVTAIDLALWGTVRDTAAAVLGREPPLECLRAARSRGHDRTIVFFPPALGTGLGFFRLLPYLPDDLSVMLVEQTDPMISAVRTGGRPEFAAAVAREIAASLDPTSLVLAGWSFGALVAPDCLLALDELGVPVDRLVLIDPSRDSRASQDHSEDWAVRRLLADFGYGTDLPVGGLDVRDVLAIRESTPGHLSEISETVLRRWVETMVVNAGALFDPQPPAPTVPTLVVRGARTKDAMQYPSWVDAAGGQPTEGADPSTCVDVVDVDATHFELLSPTTVRELGSLITRFLGC